jgi:hypothetical protein
MNEHEWTPEHRARMICNLGDAPLITEDERICQDIDAVLEQRRNAKLREILFAVIDDGDATIDGQAYALWHPFEETALEARFRFIERVIERMQR